MAEPLVFDAAAAESAVRETVREHSTWFLVQAVLHDRRGLVALVYPLIVVAGADAVPRLDA